MREGFQDLLSEQNYCVVINPSNEQLKVNNPDLNGKFVDFAQRNFTNFIAHKKMLTESNKSNKTKKIEKTRKKNTIKKVSVWLKMRKLPRDYESLNWIFNYSESKSPIKTDFSGKVFGPNSRRELMKFLVLQKSFFYTILQPFRRQHILHIYQFYVETISDQLGSMFAQMETMNSKFFIYFLYISLNRGLIYRKNGSLIIEKLFFGRE